MLVIFKLTVVVLFIVIELQIVVLTVKSGIHVRSCSSSTIRSETTCNIGTSI